MPSNKEFFEDFQALSDNLIAIVGRFSEALGDIGNLEERHKAVTAAERRGDELIRQTLHRLDGSFVTPFDREDIHGLAEALEDVVDEVYHVSESMLLMGITEVLPEVKEQSDVLVAMSALVRRLTDSLQNMRNVRPLLEELDALETDGDRIYRRMVARLFGGEFDALDVIKWKDIGAALEAALDRIEDLGDIVESILVKHA
jgi:uncharacterized protein